jgi:hypothetical protein
LFAAIYYRKGAGRAGEAGTKVTDLPYNPTSSSGVILCPVMSICSSDRQGSETQELLRAAGRRIDICTACVSVRCTSESPICSIMQAV